MGKRILIFILFFVALCPAFAAPRATTDRFINKSLYQNIYPSTLNDRVQNAALNAQSGRQSGTAVKNRSVVKRPQQMRPHTTNNTTQNASATTASTTNANRRVVPRATNAARVGTTTSAARPNVTNNSSRRVVARAGTTNNNRARSATYVRNTNTTTTTTTNHMTSQQCFANYQECMDGYCERSDTAYNRCYCSAKLAQIDSRYQPKIDSLVQQIIKLKYNTDATDEEIKEYWDSTIGTYTHTNPWTNIDNALNIDWASTESRVRGQNAFATGHSYCVAHLRTCSYMATNLRDAYKSEIERDCANYERGLSRIQIAAESVIESYNQ